MTRRLTHRLTPVGVRVFIHKHYPLAVCLIGIVMVVLLMPHAIAP